LARGGYSHRQSCNSVKSGKKREIKPSLGHHRRRAANSKWSEVQSVRTNLAGEKNGEELASPTEEEPDIDRSKWTQGGKRDHLRTSVTTMMTVLDHCGTKKPRGKKRGGGEPWRMATAKNGSLQYLGGRRDNTKDPKKEVEQTNFRLKKK